MNGVLCSLRNFLSYCFTWPYGSASPLHHRCDTDTSDSSCHGTYRVSCTLFPWPVLFTGENFAFFTFLSAVSELGCVHVTFAFFTLLVSDYFTSPWLTARLSHDWFRLVVLLILSLSFPAFAFVNFCPLRVRWFGNLFTRISFVSSFIRSFFFFSFHHNILSPVRGTLSTTNSNRHLVFVFFSLPCLCLIQSPCVAPVLSTKQFLDFYHPLLTQFPSHAPFRSSLFCLITLSHYPWSFVRSCTDRSSITFVHSFIRSFACFIRAFT